MNLAFMNFACSIVGIAYASFFVWLVVRIINRREKWAIKLAVDSGIAFVVLAFTTPFVTILFLDMVRRQHPTTEECILLFGIPSAIFVFLLGTVLYRPVDRCAKWVLPFPSAKRSPECEPDRSDAPPT